MSHRSLINKIILVLGMAVLAPEAPAQTLSSNGSTAYPILSVGLGARAAGMGDSFTAVADDLSALHYNAAGLAQIHEPQLALMHNGYLDSGFYDTLGFAYPFGDSGTLGLGLNYLNYGSIDKRDALGNLLGSYTPFDIGFSGGFGFKVGKDFCLGFASQWIRQEINGTAHTGLLWDGGFLVFPFERFSLGLNLKNSGVDSGGYNLPTELSAGTAYRLSLAKEEVHSLLLSLDGDWALQGVSRLILGFEYALEKRYFLRGGYARDLQDNPSDSAKGLNFGAGVKLGQFQFDYSFSFMGDLGDVQRFSLSVFFPPVEKQVSTPKTAPAGNVVTAKDEPIFLPPAYKTDRPVVLKFQVKSRDSLTAQELFDEAEEKQRMGLKEEALDLYLKAVDKDPNFQQAWMSLGKLYFDQSLESYRKVLEMDPKNGKLREWLNHFKP